MSEEVVNEIEATETTEATEEVTEEVIEEMPLPEGLETAGAKGDDTILNTLLGVVAEQEEAEPSEPEATDEADEPAEESTPEPKSDNQGDDYERAMAALQRDGTPRHILDEEYDRNPDRFVEWGLKRAKVQSDGDRFSQEHAELKSQLEQTQQGGEQTEGGVQAGNTPETQAQPAMHPDLATQKNRIAEIFGDEAAEAVWKPMESLAQSMSGIIQQQEMRLVQLSQMVEQKELASVRSNLQERFPQLTDDKQFEQVKEKMTALVKTGQYDTYSDVMLDAARIMFADAIESGNKSTKINQAKSAGQPRRKSTASNASRPRTTDDRDDQVLESLMGGMTPDDVAKQFKI
jgi:Arc/MetJ-type ribon-helix-helix transcriptional regulator